MNNYKIITNPDLLKRWIKEFLPDLQENEQYYCCLFARKKYCKEVPWIKSDKSQLKRFTSKKEFLFNKIHQLEVPFGAYELSDNPVPQAALAVYVSANPRDLWKATVRSIGKLANVLECNGKNSNPHQEVMSEIQKTVGTRKYVCFDVDVKSEDDLTKIINLCDGYCNVTETRGGYHVFILKDKVDQIKTKNWYQEISKYAEQTGDLMTPPWGTLQGGWEVRPKYLYVETN
jgi:hypothetical protein